MHVERHPESLLGMGIADMCGFGIHVYADDEDDGGKKGRVCMSVCHLLLSVKLQILLRASNIPFDCYMEACRKRKELPFVSLNGTDKIDFGLLPLTCGLPFPENQIDFALPASWRFNPPAYKHVNLNRYVDPLSRSMFVFEESPPCSCSVTDGCNPGSCENFQLSMECTPGACPSMRGQSGEFCKNTIIQRAAYPHTEVFKTSDCGYGLFTLEDLPTDSLIAEYRGEVITEKECLRRMAGYKADAHFYFAHLDGGLVLDAAVYGSTARFANHSCEPNCTLQKWITNGEPRVVLVALRTIKSGSELTYNYQYYQDGLDDIARRFKRQKCACGSPVCCGTIGGRVTTQHPLYEREKWTEKVVSLLDQSESASGTCSSGRPAKRFTMDSVEELLLFANEEDRKMAGTDLSYRYCITTEYERLTALAVRVRAWQAEVELLLASPAAVDITDFDDIVRAQPSRLKVSRALTAKIDLVRRGVKGVEQHRKYLPGPLPPVEVDSSSRLLPVPVTGDRLSWPVFCSLVQALSEATPIRCGVEALYVLKAYQQYSKWCEITFRALKLRTDTYKMESDERTLPQLWYSLLRIAELYDEKVTPIAFFIEQCLEQRMNSYIYRMKLRRPDVATMSTSETHTIPCQSDSSTCLVDDASHEITAADAATSSVYHKDAVTLNDTTLGRDQEEVHCLCRLPENASEIQSFLQCGLCENWFHMECANVPTCNVTEFKKNSTVKHEFVCPLCQFEGGSITGPNNFLHCHSYEWHRGSATSMSYSQLCKGYDTAEKLVLLETPLSKLLGRLKDLVDEWRCEASQAMAIYPSPESWLSISEIKLGDAGKIDTITSPVALIRVAEFQELLELYFSPRILCVCTEEVSSLRMLIWRCCFARLFGSRLCDIALGKCHRDSGEMTLSLQQYKATLTECKRYIRSGKSLINVGRSAVSIASAPVELSVLSDAVETAVSLLQKAYICDDVEESACIAMELDKFTVMGIRLSDEYAYARVKSLAWLHLPYRERISKEFHGDDTGSAAAPRYCWCRGVDNGDPMVGCEGCEEWFHYTCVGVLTRKHIKLLKENDYECIACCALKSGRKYSYNWGSNWYGSDNKKVGVSLLKHCNIESSEHSN